MIKPDPNATRDAQKDLSSEKRLRWWSTAVTVISATILALSFAVCVRTDQQALPQPNGTLIWHQQAYYRLASFASDHGPIPPPAPAELPAIEWIGFGQPITTSASNALTSKTTESGSLFSFVLLSTPPISTVCAIRLWWRFWRRWRWSRRGACKTCGYDLAGLAAAACCPECGGSLAGRAAISPGSESLQA